MHAVVPRRLQAVLKGHFTSLNSVYSEGGKSIERRTVEESRQPERLREEAERLRTCLELAEYLHTCGRSSVLPRRQK